MTKRLIEMSHPKSTIILGLISIALFSGIAGFGASKLPEDQWHLLRHNNDSLIRPKPWVVYGRGRQPGRGSSTSLPNIQYLSIKVGGINRSFYLSSSLSRASSNSPLLIMLHGGGGSARSVMSVTNLAEAGAKQGIDVIFPEGTDVGHPFRWNTGLVTGSKIDKVDDADFLDELVHTYAPNNRPVFLAGLSNGGMMALRQLCQGRSRFSGAFIVAAGTSDSILKSCTNTYQVPIAIINGRLDSIVPYDGGLIQRGGRGTTQTLSNSPLLPNRELVDFWRTRNKCLNSPAAVLPIRQNSLGPQDISIRNYSRPLRRCSQTLSLVLNDGNHGWPKDTDNMTPREKLRLQIRQRFAGRLIGSETLDPGNLDTTRLITTLVQEWSSK